MQSDGELLALFVREGSQAAFAEVVRRRINLVYSVSLRQVDGDVHLAEDVTQRVFVDLARKAESLTDCPSVSGWLFRGTHYAASDMVRTERRRRVRETESQAMNETDIAETGGVWTRLRPLLDEALAALDGVDRDAVAMRFFENRGYTEIGQALQLTEEAARKRVERSLAKPANAIRPRDWRCSNGARRPCSWSWPTRMNLMP